MEDFAEQKDWTFVDLVKQIYLTWDGPAGNDDKGHLLCNYLALMLTATIFVAFLVDFAQSVPSQRVQPTACANPVCNNVSDICPGTMVCEPTTAPTYLLIEAICNYIFTIEYAIRFFSLWAVDSRDAEVVPLKWPLKKPDPVYPLWEHYARWIIQFRNLVDLATILPFYVVEGAATQFVRVFRLLRVFKMLRQFVNVQRMLDLMIRTITVSLPAMSVLVGFMLMGMIFFGSILYQAESGTFVVNAEYPNGVYLRRTINGAGWEVSPFRSIPVSFYYVITTITTVGYGDLTATSWVGRGITCVLMFLSLIMLALPISVIGSNFSDLYKEAISAGWNAVGDALKIDDLDEVGMISLFHEIDVDGYGYLDEEKLYNALSAAGFSQSRSWLRLMISVGDGNGDGRITCDDFIELCFKIQGSSRVRMLFQDAQKPDDALGQNDSTGQHHHHHHGKITSVQLHRSLRFGTWNDGSDQLNMDEAHEAFETTPVRTAKTSHEDKNGIGHTNASAHAQSALRSPVKSSSSAAGAGAAVVSRAPSSLLRDGSSKSSLVSAADPTCVLVVDDTSSTRKIICRLLSSVWTNLVILEAADGTRAVEIVREAGESIDYVFMDNSMPTMNGPEATRILREELGYERIIVGMTDHGLGSVKLFKTSGASEVLRKPVTKAALQALKLQISKKLTRNASSDDLASSSMEFSTRLTNEKISPSQSVASITESIHLDSQLNSGESIDQVGLAAIGYSGGTMSAEVEKRLGAQHKRILKLLDANRLAYAELDAMRLELETLIKPSCA